MIVEEDFTAFYRGNRTAAETARIIQNRHQYDVWCGSDYRVLVPVFITILPKPIENRGHRLQTNDYCNNFAN